MANIKRANTSGITKSGVAIPDVPDAPTIGAATNVGTARAFNNGSATVAFTANPRGGTSTSFTATSTPGSFTATGAGSPLTVTGLQSATSYTFAVTGTNASATGPASAASSSITATTVPAAPTIGTFTDGGTGTTGTLSFTAPATGGSTITNYSYSTDSSTYTTLSPAQTTSPLSLTGLTTGTYNFSVKAINSNGTSAASSTVSGTVSTPTSWETIGSALPSTGTVTFTNIPQTYKSLVLRVSYLLNSGSGGSSRLRLNENSAANYSQIYMTSYNTSNGGGFQTGANGWTLDYNSVYGSNATYPTVIEVEFPGYASSTNYRVAYAKYATVSNSPTSASEQGSFAAYWDVTSAISSISWVPSTACNGDGYVALYGLK